MKQRLFHKLPNGKVELVQRHPMLSFLDDAEQSPEPNRQLSRVESRPSPPESCLLYTSPSPRDRTRSRMPSSA